MPGHCQCNPSMREGGGGGGGDGGGGGGINIIISYNERIVPAGSRHRCWPGTKDEAGRWRWRITGEITGHCHTTLVYLLSASQECRVDTRGPGDSSPSVCQQIAGNCRG